MVTSAKNLSVIQGGKSESDAIGFGTKKWATGLRARAKALVKKLEDGYMDLAKLLWQVYDTPVDGDPKNKPLFMEWGFRSFGEYAEQELGIHQRKAERLRKIWKALVDLDLGPDFQSRVARLGWTKVRELIRVMTDTNAEEWVAKAEHYNYLQVTAAVKQYETEIEKIEKAREALADAADDELPTEALPEATIPDPEDFFPEKFVFAAAQHDNVKLALGKAAQLSNSTSKNNNFDLICTDFLASNDFLAADDPDRVVKYLRKIERAFGIKIIALDGNIDEILFGNRTFDAMMAKSLKGE
jgi:hypothetical protein